MPTVETIEHSLFQLAPACSAMEWDNVGLLIGDPHIEVRKILVALDITEAVAEEAVSSGAQLIVAHHPVMNCTWHPVQTLREDHPQGRLLRKLTIAGISAICMHTNLDAAAGGVNDILAEALKVVDPGPLSPEGFGRVGTLRDGPMALSQFLPTVFSALHCSGLRYADAGQPVFRIAVGGGACGEFVDQAIAAGCDTFVTSDLKYHDFLDGTAKGINLIDAGHFPTEDLICPVLVQYLQQHFPETAVQKSAVHREIIQYYVKGESSNVRTF